MAKTTFENIKKDFFQFVEAKDFLANLNLPQTMQKILFPAKIYVLSAMYTGEKIFDNYYLHKEFKIPKSKKVLLPPELIEDTLDINNEENISNCLKENIINFINDFRHNFKEEYLHTFFYNLQSLNVKKINMFRQNKDKDSTILATYDVGKNKITICENTNFISIYHELLHMASSYYDEEKNIEYCGFQQRQHNTDIGVGLNEGYTEYLTGIVSQEKANCYAYEKHIAIAIGAIVGQNKMKDFYFKANLKGLIKELTKYEKEKNIMSFLTYLDFYSNYCDNTAFLPTKNEKLKICDEYIKYFLLKLFVNKITFIITSPKFKNKYPTTKERLNQIRLEYNKIFWFVNLPRETIINYLNQNTEYHFQYAGELLQITNRPTRGK